LYSGEQFDSKIGQQYLRQRYYDPTTGRFNRLDPFFGHLNDPQSLHKYLYTHANPVNGIDPSGQFAGVIGIGISLAVGCFNQSRGAATNLGAYATVYSKLQALAELYQLAPILYHAVDATLLAIIFGDDTDIKYTILQGGGYYKKGNVSVKVVPNFGIGGLTPSGTPYGEIPVSIYLQFDIPTKSKFFVGGKPSITFELTGNFVHGNGNEGWKSLEGSITGAVTWPLIDTKLDNGTKQGEKLDLLCIELGVTGSLNLYDVFWNHDWNAFKQIALGVYGSIVLGFDMNMKNPKKSKSEAGLTAGTAFRVEIGNVQPLSYLFD
jgi:RHS repeat-associated protein